MKVQDVDYGSFGEGLFERVGVSCNERGEVGAGCGVTLSAGAGAVAVVQERADFFPDTVVDGGVEGAAGGVHRGCWVCWKWV